MAIRVPRQPLLLLSLLAGSLWTMWPFFCWLPGSTLDSQRWFFGQNNNKLIIVSLTIWDITLADNYCLLSGWLNHVHPSCFWWLKHVEPNVNHVLLMNFQFLHGEILWTVGWHDTSRPCQPWSKFQGFSCTSAEAWTPASEGQFEAKTPIIYGIQSLIIIFTIFVWEVIHRIHCLFYFSHTHIPSDYLWQFAMKWLHGHYCIRKSDAHGRFPITINYIPEGKKKHWPLA
jgi:hypothetical protein